MDKASFESRLTEGLERLGVQVGHPVADALFQYMAELLRWNSKVNLTAITAPAEVLEKHFLDSLAVLPEVAGAGSLLDLGAGAGLPGIPLKVALPSLQVTLVDAVAKKVAFMKQAAATLRLVPGCRAVHLHVAGSPEREGLARAELCIARAFKDLRDWLPLARAYTQPGGRIVAMLGKAPAEEEARGVGDGFGVQLLALRRYALPFSGAERAVATFRVP